MLDGLSPREAKVLRMRFGIDMSSDHTLEEVGRQFDVTRERIRQIEAKAMRKLKHPSLSGKLRATPRRCSESLAVSPRLGRAPYAFSRGDVDVLSAGVEPPGASGLAGAGAFFGFFASLLPR